MANVAFVLADDFEDSEFKVPYDRITRAGHQVTVIGSESGKEVRGKKGKESFTLEATPDEVNAADFDALVIPGGYAPDKLRMSPGVVKFVKGMFEGDKPVAAICHAGSLLVEADAVRGRTVTSWPSIRTDLINAGADWVDREVAEDGNLITSRKPDDLDAFVDAILGRL
ncbi:MAG: type 1 glutamine amidotransferase [Actinobacteria bacterium]|nr:type 1 glutamine amidotransferase [Actinomycetota bacterium]MBW3649999.1 type 1 glutamine amidotransferase [Actinomycetota bacterium]